MSKPQADPAPSPAPPLMRTAGLVGALTLVSRITGMLQSRFVAYHLGVGPAADAFFVAYRIPNLLRRFTAEGTMTSAFLPTLSEAERNQGEPAGRDLAAAFLGTLGTLMAFLCALAIPAMGLITGLQMLGRLAPGAPWSAQLAALGQVLAGTRPAPEAWRLTTTLAQIMIPYLALVSLTAGLAAVLNLRGRFGLPASVSTFWNLAFMAVAGGALMAGPASWREPERAALVMALAVLVAGVVQLAVLWPAFRRLGFGLRWGLHLGHPGVRAALRRMAPGLLGTGIHPINVLVSTVLASQLAPGAQTVLFNANMMSEMVLGVFAASVATVSLPAMSRLAEAGDRDGLRRSLAEALRATALLAIPGALGMAVLARPIIAVIFQTGRFGADAVAWTATTLAYQSVGILFVAAGRISAQCLYAVKDYRRPALAALLGMAVNIALSLVLMGPLGTGGIALANGLAGLAGLAYLLAGLRRPLQGLPWADVLRGWGAMALGAALMGAAAWTGARTLGLGAFHGLVGTSLRLFPLIALCAAVYAGAVLALGLPEARAALAGVRRRFSR